MAAREFYVDKLGFRVVEEGGDPARFGILDRGGATFFLTAWDGSRPPVPTTWDAYIHVDGLARLHDAFTAAGVNVSREPSATGYGMREFEVTDPDGNVLCFGEPGED